MLDSLSSSQVAALMKSGLVRTISRRIISDLSLVSQSSSHLQTLSPGQTDTLISHNRNKQPLLPFLLLTVQTGGSVTCATDDHVSFFLQPQTTTTCKWSHFPTQSHTR